MNLRCFYCQTPFTIGRAELLAALQQMEAENLNHYDAHCPRCRRANSVARQRMEMFFPNWREAAEEQAAMPPAPPQTDTAPAPVAVMPPAKVEAAPLAAKPARKRSGSPKKAPAKPAAKTSAKKPAAKAKPAATSKAKPTTTTTKKTTGRSKKK